MSEESPDITIPQHALDEPERLAAVMTSLVERAGRLTIHHVPGDPAHIQYLRQPGGKVDRVVTTPMPRRDVVTRVADLVSLAARASAAATREITNPGGPAIFVNEGHAILVWDVATGRDTTTMPLPISAEWKFFRERLGTPTVDVKTFRRALETTLRQTFTDTKLVAQIGSLGTNSQGTTGVKSERARESLGTATLQEVSDPAGLPSPTLTFSPLMFNHPDMPARYAIQVDIEPELSSQQWVVMPREDSVRDFVSRNLDLLALQFVSELEEASASVPVYRGAFARKE